ncbi:alpha/beta hydrolase [Dactylosporangium vinaceum]|uniref:Alpha/beta fold hydrolase n=1 Tax=Dactylosporangium vinaceum TaxID=53362 RepID=A0ABV5MBP0_9ACTN|nr:alpha/beta hydrolase [Dactylosporangium vinaceum]UAB98507.1 alpha/beta hydrolase [Dactylosporangium vinaceum]
MAEIELGVGIVEYRDTGGDGPVMVLLHGLLMDATLWDAVIADVSRSFRVIAPTLPLGAHRTAVHADADLSLAGIAAVTTELLERLELRDVTLVGNDTGGAVAQLVAAASPRVGRLVLVACEAFDNLPPGLTGRTVAALGKLPPGLFRAFMQQMRLKPARRLPIAFGWLTKRGDAATRAWMEPILTRPGIARDAVRALRSLFADRAILLRAAEDLRTFDRPALVVWAAGDRVMPPEHGRRLAALLPQGKLVTIDDTATLIPLDQPARLAAAIQSW